MSHHCLFLIVILPNFQCSNRKHKTRYALENPGSVASLVMMGWA